MTTTTLDRRLAALERQAQPTRPPYVSAASTDDLARILATMPGCGLVKAYITVSPEDWDTPPHTPEV